MQVPIAPPVILLGLLKIFENHPAETKVKISMKLNNTRTIAPFFI
jgi:hypothetical protein